MNISTLQKNAFDHLQILVLGDAMIDQYIYGKVNRMSPEADVPIVDVVEKECRLGGAANVALNISSLGAKAHLMTFKGNDAYAASFKQLLAENNICHALMESERRTTVKTRIYNNNSYVLRYDEEDVFPISNLELDNLIFKVENALKKGFLNAIVLQDYNKGFFTKESIAAFIALAKQYKTPVVVDPKKDNFFEFKGADLFKPNLKEVNQALGTHVQGNDKEGLIQIGQVLLNQLQCKNVLITLAQHGAFAINNSGHYFVEAHHRNVVDVSGAGDTVIAMAALLMAMRQSMETVLHYSNLAGGLVIENRGVLALSKENWEKII